jgi:hypothetical protein
MDAHLVGVSPPHEFQPRDVGRRQLRERTERLTVVGTTDAEPVVRLRRAQAVGGDGAIRSQDIGDGRLNRASGRRRLLCDSALLNDDGSSERDE